MEYIHLTITLRQLIVAILDSTKKKSTIIHLLDYQFIPFNIRYLLIRKFPNIEFIFTKEKTELILFNSCNENRTTFLSRNISINRFKFKTINNWKPSILHQKTYNIGYIYHSGPFYSKLIRNICDEIILREDGLSNYMEYSVPIIKGIIRCILYRVNPKKQVWGDESWISKIEVETPNKLPLSVRYKGSEFKFAKLISLNKNNQQLKRLLSCFDINFNNRNNSESALILTQPIDIDGYCSKNDKLVIYGKIINLFNDRNIIVYMKNHPREKQYQLPSVYTLPHIFPMELLPYCLEQKFKYCIALCSTALSLNDHSIAENEIQVIPLEKFRKEYFPCWSDYIDKIKLS